jgi:hypothetical protein
MVNYKVRWLLGKPFEHPFNDVLGPAFASAAVTFSLFKKEKLTKAVDPLVSTTPVAAPSAGIDSEKRSRIR